MSDGVERHRTVAGAVIAQFSQALGSFALQVQVARLLGSEGLALFALLYGLIVVGTAVMTGFVGDTLTVLDRASRPIRAGLQWWLVVLSAVLGAAAVVGATASDVLSLGDAVLFAVAGVVFVLEDSIRRLLMASMRFWSIVVVDAVSVVGSVGLVAVVDLGGGEVTISTFLWALLVGQVAAGVVAIALLPADDRQWVRGVAPARAPVWEYGRWRALQHSVGPVMLSSVRVVAVAAVGRAAYGELEGARLFVAPAMLAVNGASNYLFASFARSREAPLRHLLRRSDLGVVALGGASLLIGGLAVAAVPTLGSAVVSERVQLDAVAVLGWSVYAATTAAATPYGVLAAVRCRQRTTFAIRAGTSVAAVAAVAGALEAGWPVSSIPFVMSAFSLAGGLAIRGQLVATATSAPSAVTAGSASSETPA